MELGISEILEDDEGVVAVEWPERLGDLAPADAVRITIQYPHKYRQQVDEDRNSFLELQRLIASACECEAQRLLRNTVYEPSIRNPSPYGMSRESEIVSHCTYVPLSRSVNRQ